MGTYNNKLTESINMGFTDNNISVDQAFDLNNHLETVQKLSLDVKRVIDEIDKVNADLDKLIKILKAMKKLSE